MPTHAGPCGKATRRPIVPYDRDALDDLIDTATAAFRDAEGDWDAFALAIRDPRNDMSPNVAQLRHPAASLLTTLRTVGATAASSHPPWTPGRIAMALARGPHKSATENAAFLCLEFADMMRKGHWTMLPAEDVRHITNLRLSPLGVVPQRDRRPRPICDYTFFGVNDETATSAPMEAMQFGKALQRILHKIHSANSRLGPVYLSKIDLADGFYRIGVRPSDIPSLAVLFPSRIGERQLVAFPLTLPMGWKESPPYFSAATETITDVANAHIHWRPPPHRLYQASETPPASLDAAGAPAPPCSRPADLMSVRPPLHGREPSAPSYQRPLAYWDVYVDDFIGVVQGNKHRRRRVKEVLLHALDDVFRPLDPSDNPNRQEPASLKKMSKGDAAWTTTKTILGWQVDTLAHTIALPPHRAQRLHDILATIAPFQRRVAIKTWHQLLGELRLMVLAIPGGRGLFSLLQETFRHRDRAHRLRLTPAVHATLSDWRWLARSMTSRPTRISELFPSNPPHTIGACDAAATGMGGVHFIPTPQGSVLPVLWRQQFPPTVARNLVSFTNPRGVITNSDLELTGTLAHSDVLAQYADVRDRTTHTFSDNTPAVSWQRKGSTTTTGPAAALLRLQALHQQHHRYIGDHGYIPGTVNAMADDCSRAWHLSDTQLLRHFDTTYPQAVPWLLCPLQPAMNSALISCLFKAPYALASVLNVPTPTTTSR